MRHAQPIVVLATLVSGFLAIALPRTFGQSDQNLSAAIAFQPDEQTVFVQYQGSQWAFSRPVVSPWAYQEVSNVYWVATDGADTNAGTPDSPFGTISHAIRRVQPGDIVYVKAGTYVEHLSITKSGKDGLPIIISCAPGDLGNVTVTPSADYVTANPSGSVVGISGAQYIWINGLVIEGPKGRPEAPTSEHFSANGITWSNGAGYGCRATNNVVYANVHCGLKEMDHGGSNILMEGNVIFDNGTNSLDHGIYCPADDCTIDGNIIFNNAGWGLQLYPAPQNLLVYRNICFGNLTGGIVLAAAFSMIFNNDSVSNPIGIMYFRDGCTGNVVENNIFAFNTQGDGIIDDGDGMLGDPSNNTDDYNVYFPGQLDPPELLGLDVTVGASELFVDPQFINADQGDFRYADGSPCIGGGTPINLPDGSTLSNMGAF
jgi:hypothetical protein